MELRGGGSPLRCLFASPAPPATLMAFITQCYSHGPHTGRSVPVLSNRLKDPRKLWSFPVLFSSQVVFPHHRPHGHLHIHRSHSGLRWPLLCLGEFPFHTLWRVPSLTWKVGLISPEAKRMQIARSPGPGPLLLTSV